MEVSVESQDDTTAAYEGCRKCNRWELVKERVRVKELLLSAIEKFETQFKSENYKPSLGDYLKLVALKKKSIRKTSRR